MTADSQAHTGSRPIGDSVSDVGAMFVVPAEEGQTMQVEYDSAMQCFRIQKDHYAGVTLVNYSNNFDSFAVVDDNELVVYAYGGVIARFNSDGRMLM